MHGRSLPTLLINYHNACGFSLMTGVNAGFTGNGTGIIIACDFIVLGTWVGRGDSDRGQGVGDGGDGGRGWWC